MNKQIIEKIQNKLPMDIKKFAISMGFLTMVMTACGRNVVDTTVQTQQPTTTIENNVTPVEDEPEVTIPVVEPVTDPVVDPEPVVEENKFPDATVVQTDDNHYTLYVDCPDNSNAPELTYLPEHDGTKRFTGSAETFGVSENLLVAFMTRGMQVNPLNIAQINFDAFKDQPFIATTAFGTKTCVLTNDISSYEGVWVYTQEDLKASSVVDTPSVVYNVSTMLLKNCILSADNNITCGMAKYYMGPELWDEAMQQCQVNTGLTTEDIYKNYDYKYVLEHSQLEMNTDGVISNIEGVMSYINPNEEISITNFDSNGNVQSTITYNLDRVKTYGTIQP